MLTLSENRSTVQSWNVQTQSPRSGKDMQDSEPIHARALDELVCVMTDPLA